MSKTSRYALFALPLLVFLGMALLFWHQIGTDPSELPSARLGKPLPEFQLSSLKEPAKMLTQNDVKGQVSLLNVWATWCISCQEEHGELMTLANAGVPIIGANYKDTRVAALQYLSSKGDPFQFVIFDEKGSFGLDLGVYGAPETYLIDKDGHVRYRYVGVLDDQHWQTELKPRYEALKQGKPLPDDAGA